MRELTCNHCSNTVKADDKACPSCGMPLSLKKSASPQRRFIFWFIALVIFAIVMMLLLPFFGSSRFDGY
jgi:predicted nucleic acid-binding Zn ribbon protein